MRTSTIAQVAAVAVMTLALGACGQSEGQGGRRVFFIQPADGATVKSPVRLEFGAQDFTIAAVPPGTVTETRPDLGHHHVAIDADCFTGLDVRGKAVLVQTGWARHWKTDQYFEGHSFLTEAAANALKTSGAALVGIDSYNIDDTADGRRPVHTILLGADILIVEHMCNLETIPDGVPFKFYAVPVKVKAFGTFPVRAFALVAS